MRRRKSFIAEILILFLVDYVLAVPQWNYELFLAPKNVDEHVVFTPQDDSLPSFGQASIWEGVEGKVELMRLSFQPDGDSLPTVSYSGPVGLGLTIARDDDEKYPVYLHTTEPGDYEAGIDSFFIILTAPSNTQSDVGYSTAYVTVVLENVNDNPPIIKSPLSCKFEEERLYGADQTDVVCEFTITDADTGACFVTTTIDDEHFELRQTSQKADMCGSATFVLDVIKPLDFESYRLHSLQISVLDEGIIGLDGEKIKGGNQEQEITFVVDVDDIPDMPPVWETMVPYMSVIEKTESQTFRFRARDGDYGLNWGIKYSLKFTEEYEDYLKYFEINEEGILNVLYIDRDAYQIDIINFEVVATEVVPSDYKDPNFQPMSISNPTVVVVVDINDHEPEIDPESVPIEIDEETTFTVVFTVSDPDMGDNGRHNLRLEGPEEDIVSNFMLVPSSGYQLTEVSVTPIDPSKLDYEDSRWREITLTLVAEEVASKEHVGRATLTIRLIDVLDEPPEFDQDICNEIQKFEENQKAGYLVVHTIATDPDEQDHITYSLNNNYIQVDQEGRVTSIYDNSFDYERQPEIVLQVVAEDLTNMRAFCVVNIQLIDINDEPPTIVMPSASLEVNEHSASDTPLSKLITATDPDKDAVLTFEINWENSVVYKQGVALEEEELYKSSVKLQETEHENGEWTTMLLIDDCEKYDWEVFDSMRLQIDVIDLDTHEDYEHNRIRSAILTVTVGDINDCAPIFTEETEKAYYIVNENEKSGRYVGAVLATDEDSAKNSQIKYFIEPIFPDELAGEPARLRIDQKTGQMYTTDEEIDCDEWQTLVYRYKVFATDDVHVTNITIDINIQDENDESPDIIDPVSLIIEESFVEETEGRWPIGVIEGFDKDVTEDFHTISYFIQGTAQNFFEMDEYCLPNVNCTLYTINGSNLDREKQDFHEIEVFSRDNFKDKINTHTNDGPTVTVYLTITDINDNNPEFEVINTPFEVRENEAPADFHVFSVKVTDEDIGDNAKFDCESVPKVTLTYPVRPDEDVQGLFEVKTEDDGCAVYTKDDLVGHWGEYSLELTAIDRGIPPLPGYGTYQLTVINVNLNDPVIIHPTEGTAILIRRIQATNGPDPLIDINGNFIEDFTAFDADDQETPNGQVAFELSGAESYFYVNPSSTNTAVLRMWRGVDNGERKFSMTLIARDMGTLISRESVPVNFVVWVLNSVSYPEFTNLEPEIVKFTENETGLAESATLREAFNLDEEPLPEIDRRLIYYYIIEGETNLFELDKKTRKVRLLNMLDYEVQKVHTLKIFATHTEEDPNFGDANDFNVLQIIVQVVDENDEPPRFTQDLFPGTFSAEHRAGQHILDLEAYDPDEEDEMYFEMIPGTISTTDDSLKPFASDDAFVVDLETGVITLNFNPGGNVLSGYFEFSVQVYDSKGNIDGHRDEGLVNVFVVSDSHRMIFIFFNPSNAVETRQKEMAEVFSEVLGYTCVVEEVIATDNENGAETSNVVTHFIDEADKSPVPKKSIEDQFLDENTYVTLSRKMSDIPLSFLGYDTPAQTDKTDNKITTIALAAVCAVLAVMVFVFLMAFIVRTRTLNQRLEKLTSKKFGSQDSGLNRGDMMVPGTNKHRLEGSNPVWNNETIVGQMFDGLSLSSGDSDMIGIEDHPQFDDKLEIGGINNPVFQPEPSVNQFVMASAPSAVLDGPRRTSLNPMAMASTGISANDGFDAHSIPSLEMSLDDIDMPRRISLSPLTSDMNIDLDSVEVDKGPVIENNNFTFQSKVEPSTEL